MAQGQTGPMGIAELVESFKSVEDLQMAFKGSGQSGSGSSGDKGGSAGHGQILSSDVDGMGLSLEDIAEGKVRVTFPT